MLRQGVEVAEDSGIVGRADGERFLGEEQTLGQCGPRSVLGENTAKGLVLVLGGDDYDVVIVLGGAADQRDAAYVDFLDYVGLGRAGRNRLREGVEVDNHQVDFGYFVLLGLELVLLVVAAGEDAPENFGMQGLYSATEYRRIAG